MTDTKLPPLRIAAHDFTSADLCGGHVALDFVNTAAGLNRDPRDWLDSYARLVSWAELAGVCDARHSADLRAQDRADLADGTRALAGARDLRAALYELVHHAGADTRPPDAAVAVLQRWCRRAGAALELDWTSGVLQPSLRSCGLDVIGASIAQAAAGLLAQPLAGRIGTCGGRNCGWVFLDTSKSRRRRWCDMKTCGNAAKASRHYHRHRALSPVEPRLSPAAAAN